GRLGLSWPVYAQLPPWALAGTAGRPPRLALFPYTTLFRSGDGNLENAACGDRVHSLDGLVEQVVDVDAEHGVDVPIGHASTHELPQVLSDGGSVHEVGGRRSDAAAASTLAFIGACVGVAVLTAAAGAEGLSIRAAAVVGFGVVAAGAGDEPVVVAAGCGLEAAAAAFSDELVFVEPSPDAVGLGVGEGVGEALGAHGAGGADAFR